MNTPSDGSRLTDPVGACGAGAAPYRGVVPIVVLGAVVVIGSAVLLLSWGGLLGLPPIPPFFPALWFVVPLGFILFWILLLGVIRPWSWRRSWGWGDAWSVPADAREIVRQRYARGEIPAERMAQMLRDLDAGAGLPPGGSPHR